MQRFCLRYCQLTDHSAPMEPPTLPLNQTVEEWTVAFSQCTCVDIAIFVKGIFQYNSTAEIITDHFSCIAYAKPILKISYKLPNYNHSLSPLTTTIIGHFTMIWPHGFHGGIWLLDLINASSLPSFCPTHFSYHFKKLSIIFERRKISVMENSNSVICGLYHVTPWWI